MSSAIFIKKNPNNMSSLSSDLPSKFEMSDNGTSPHIPRTIIIEHSATSPDEIYGSQTSPSGPTNNNLLYNSQTSPGNPYVTAGIMSQTSPDQDGKENNIDRGNYDWKNQNYYFTQLDMDIAWMDKKNDSETLLFGNLIKYFGKNTKIPLPVVTDYSKAVDVAGKICKYAYFANDPKKNELFPGDKFVKSSVEKDRCSYPLFGSVIFTMKFKEKPTITNLGIINKSQYNKILDHQNSDLVLYTTEGDRKNRAVIFNTSKLDITDIDLKTFDCALGSVKGLAILKILSTSSNENRFSAKYVDLLKKLCTEGGHIKIK